METSPRVLGRQHADTQLASMANLAIPLLGPKPQAGYYFTVALEISTLYVWLALLHGNVKGFVIWVHFKCS
jgi:hypothetical protein